MAFSFNLNLAWVIVPLLAVCIGSSVFGVSQCNKNKNLETYNRQLSGDLTNAEKTLQEFNKDLGLAQSQLLSQQELNKSLQEDNDHKDEKFEKFKEEHNLQIDSKNKSIARLQQTIKNGNSTTTISGSCDNVDKCVIGYIWSDPLNRFKLTDPNVFEQHNEIFESTQVFKLTGEVWKQKDGFLKTHRLVLVEVYKDDNGELKEVPGGKAEIVESDFKYSNSPVIEDEFEWQDLFRLRGIVMVGSEFYPEVGDLRLSVGLQFFEFEGLGINSHTAFDFDDYENIAQYISVSYTPKFLNLDLNLALAASVGTPFYNFGREVSVKVDLLFYLNN